MVSQPPKTVDAEQFSGPDAPSVCDLAELLFPTSSTTGQWGAAPPSEKSDRDRLFSSVVLRSFLPARSWRGIRRAPLRALHVPKGRSANGRCLRAREKPPVIRSSSRRVVGSRGSAHNRVAGAISRVRAIDTLTASALPPDLQRRVKSGRQTGDVALQNVVARSNPTVWTKDCRPTACLSLSSYPTARRSLSRTQTLYDRRCTATTEQGPNKPTVKVVGTR